MPLALLDKVSLNQTAFGNKVMDISAKLGVPAEWLMFVMWFESKLNSRAVNDYTGATGLIQFMPATAKGLGTTLQKLKDMSNVQQLDYVYKYLLPYKSKLKSFQDLYLSVFFPAAVGKPESTVIKAKNLNAETVAKANPAFDLDKNGEITIAEIKQVLMSRMPEALRKALSVAKKGAPVVLLLLALLAIYYFSK